MSSRTLLALKVLVLVLLVVLPLLHSGALQPVDDLWLDFLFEGYPRAGAQNDGIVTVLISERSLEALDIAYPIPRRCFTRAVEKLRALGARVIAFNFVIGESIYGQEEEELIATARRLGCVVFAVNAVRGAAVEEPFGGGPRTRGLSLAHAAFDKAGGVARAVEASVEGYPALSLELLAEREGGELFLSPGDPPGGERPWYLAPGGSARIGGKAVHLAGNRAILDFSRFRHHVLYPSMAFEDIFLGDLPQDALAGKTVIVGTTDRLFHDMHRVPLRSMEELVSGAYLQAFALESLTDGAVLHPLHPALFAALVIALVILCSLCCVRMRPLNGFALSLAVEGSLVGGSLALYHQSIILPLAAPGIAVLAVFLVTMILRAGEVQRELAVSHAFMSDVNRAGLGRSDSSQWLGRLLATSGKAVGASTGWVLTRNDEGALSLAAGLNCRGGASPEELDGGLCRRAMEEGKYTVAGDLHRTEGLSAFERRQRAGTLLCFPLRGARGPLGVIALGKPFPSQFRQRHVLYLMTIAALAGALLENVKLSGRLQEVFIDTVSSLAKAIDARDPYTYGHSARVAQFSGAIARAMGLGEDEARRIEIAGVLHDIGKIGVPEDILRKPEKLTDEEFAVMKRHPDIAVEILAPLNELYSLLPVVAGHHEKLDGTGYPRGLRREEIPLPAKILAVADIYDALTSERPYRKPSSPEEGIALMRAHFLGHIEGDIIDTFESIVLAKKEEVPGGTGT